MSTTLPRVDAPADAELISAVRGGDLDAYGELFERHVEAARRLARHLVSGPDVDDLVSEAFTKVMVVLQRGGGPDLAFRAYLLTAVRRLHVDRVRAAARLHTTDDLTPFDPGVPFRDTAVEGFENTAAARAFASLPERWQLVLWHTEVEGQKPAEVAPLLGLSPNSVSALAYRAREGLRQAFLSMHAQETLDPTCLWTQDHLGSYVRGGLSRRDAGRVENHLGECRRCTAVYLELVEVNSDLAGLLAPLLLGGAAAAYLAATTGGAAAGGLLALLGRTRDLLVGHAPATATAGVAAVAAVAAGLLLHPSTRPDAAPRTDPARPAAGDSRTATTPRVHDDRDDSPAAGRRHREPAAAPAVPVAATTDASGPSPSSPGTPPGPTSPSGDPHQPSGPQQVAPGQDQGQDQGQPPSPAGPDLAVSASATPTSGAAFRVQVTVTGLDDPGGSATLRVRADHTSVTLAADPRCSGPALGSGRCRVTATPATYTFLVAAIPDAPTTLTFTVRPDGDAADPDPSDNRARVVVGP